MPPPRKSPQVPFLGKSAAWKNLKEFLGESERVNRRRFQKDLGAQGETYRVACPLDNFQMVIKFYLMNLNGGFFISL